MIKLGLGIAIIGGIATIAAYIFGGEDTPIADYTIDERSTKQKIRDGVRRMVDRIKNGYSKVGKKFNKSLSRTSKTFLITFLVGILAVSVLVLYTYFLRYFLGAYLGGWVLKLTYVIFLFTLGVTYA